jgi:hypothetical protein
MSDTAHFELKSERYKPLVTGLLKISPTERYTGERCCRHEYFADLPEAQEYVRLLDGGGF